MHQDTRDIVRKIWLMNLEEIPVPQVVAEKEWARVLARFVVNQLPEAVGQVADIRLTAAQITELQTAFENTLITNMGC